MPRKCLAGGSHGSTGGHSSSRMVGVSAYGGFCRGEVSIPLPAFFSVELLLQAEAQRLDFNTPAEMVAIASGAHDWLGLDYRNPGGEPRIVYQEDEDSEIEDVAASFAELLGGLVLE